VLVGLGNFRQHVAALPARQNRAKMESQQKWNHMYIYVYIHMYTNIYIYTYAQIYARYAHRHTCTHTLHMYI
jgi:hypothetical protein